MQNQSRFTFSFLQEQLRLTTKTHKQRKIIIFLQKVNSGKIKVSKFMTGFGEEISATFRLQNVVLAYETQVCGKERFRNKSAKRTREADTARNKVYIFQ